MSKIIKLSSIKPFNDQFSCEIIDEINKLTGCSSRFGHYLYAFGKIKEDYFYAIRIPGKTVGELSIDKEGNIITIKMASELNKYRGVTEELQKYIGCKISDNLKIE